MCFYDGDVEDARSFLVEHGYMTKEEAVKRRKQKTKSESERKWKNIG